MREVLLLLVVIMTFGTVNGQTTINPKIGLNFSKLSVDPETATYKARSGFNIGADFRFGDRFKIIPGIHYTTHGSKLRSSNQGTDFENDIYTHWLKIPLVASANIFNSNFFQHRVYGGGVGSIFLKVDDNVFLLKEGYQPVVFGLKFGTGIDISAFTIDVDYEVGLSSVFKKDGVANVLYPGSVTNNVLTLNVGVRINK